MTDAEKVVRELRESRVHVDQAIGWGAADALADFVEAADRMRDFTPVSVGDLRVQETQDYDAALARLVEVLNAK